MIGRQRESSSINGLTLPMIVSEDGLAPQFAWHGEPSSRKAILKEVGMNGPFSF